MARKAKTNLAQGHCRVDTYCDHSMCEVREADENS